MADFDKTKRYRDWAITVNNYTPEDFDMIRDLYHKKKASYLVIGQEIAPTTGTPHLQGYVYFPNAKSFDAVLKMCPRGTHLGARYSTPQKASEYCKKIPGYEEYGTLPQRQGQRNDLAEVRDMVTEGATMEQIIDVASNYQTLRTAELLFKYKEKKRNWKPRVIWIHGYSGAGKTRKAYEMFPNLYRKTNSMGKWFEGYDAHENVLIDDVKNDSQEYYEFLLEILDRYDVLVECKGSSRQFLGRNIVCTSLWHPKHLYSKFLEGYELIRRIDEFIDLGDLDVMMY